MQTAHDRSERLYRVAEDILTRAREAKDLRTALQAIRCAVDVLGEARGYLELQGQITVELKADANGDAVSITINLPDSPSPPSMIAGQRAAAQPVLEASGTDETGQPIGRAPDAVEVDIRR